MGAGLIHHGDAAQSTSIGFAETFVLEGITASIGSECDAYDDALAETMTGMFKTEAVGRGGPFPTAQPARLNPPDEYETTNYAQTQAFQRATALGRRGRHVVASPVEEIRGLLASGSGRVVVGVTGPPGVGKSTFARRLADEFNRDGPEFAAFVPMDGFHLSSAQLIRLGRFERKGAPDTFDVSGYVTTLERVARGFGIDDVYVPNFDRAVGEPVAAALVVPRDARLVITEGNYLALADGGWAGVRGSIDRLYYLDCAPEVRRARLIERHVVGGRSRVDAANWVDVVDEPNAAVIAATEAGCDRTLRIDDEERRQTASS